MKTLYKLTVDNKCDILYSPKSKQAVYIIQFMNSYNAYV